MSELDDVTRVTQLSIPGTHNLSACYTALPSVQCQGESVRRQLENGVRFLDVRVGKRYIKKGEDAKELQVIHGKFPVRIPLGKKLQAVLQQVYDFLDEYPSETILISLKQEGTDDWKHDQDEFSNWLWNHHIEPYRNRWYTGKNMPALGECRGKVILFRRFGVREQSREYGFEAPSWTYNCPEDDRGTFVVQDYCELQNSSEIEIKVGYVKLLLHKANEYCRDYNDKLYINFCSGLNFFDHACWPEKIARAMRDGKVSDAFAPHLGIVVLDYAEQDNWDMVKRLVDTNF